MPEALETWPLPLFARLLPRHLEIIYEINRRFLDEVRAKFPGDDARLRRMSLIGEDGDKQVRMANLATVASHSINGVAELHSRLLRETVLHDFAELWPERFTNVTNGVTPRRFVALANPRLSTLITEAIGDGWQRDLDRLRGLEKHARDAGFQDRWRAVKQANKAALAAHLGATGAAPFDPAALVDAQCKRIHEYKRQHLNLLHAIALYAAARATAARTSRRARRASPARPRPAYRMAKLIIRLAHGIAEAIDGRPGGARPPARRVRARLQRQERAAHLPGRRPVGADLDRRHGGLGHRQHEVRAQRRADDRHARRRERRDPRGGRRRALLPVRPDRRGGDGAQARGLPPRPGPRRRARARARSRRLGRVLAWRSRAVPAARARPARARSVPRVC